jgi:hypothetical protein
LTTQTPPLNITARAQYRGQPPQAQHPSILRIAAQLGLELPLQQVGDQEPEARLERVPFAPPHALQLLDDVRQIGLREAAQPQQLGLLEALR